MTPLSCGEFAILPRETPFMSLMTSAFDAMTAALRPTSLVLPQEGALSWLTMTVLCGMTALSCEELAIFPRRAPVPSLVRSAFSRMAAATSHLRRVIAQQG